MNWDLIKYWRLKTQYTCNTYVLRTYFFPLSTDFENFPVPVVLAWMTAWTSLAQMDFLGPLYIPFKPWPNWTKKRGQSCKHYTYRQGLWQKDRGDREGKKEGGEDNLKAVSLTDFGGFFKQGPNPACRIFLHKILHPSSGKILKKPLFFQILRNLNGFFDFSIKKRD